ncbi:MAG: 2-hydroxyacyl-CoA dehydratase family protein [Thermodesulfobacteriota bacterium]
MKEIQLFQDIVARPYDYARNWKKEHSRKIVGHFCSYTPEEIIYAAGALPFRIFGSGDAVSRSDEHLQAYSCSFVRSALADGLTGKLDFLDGTVFPHTCDTIQRLSDIWRINSGPGFHTDIGLPVKLNTASAGEYLKNTFKKFKTELSGNLGTDISADALISTAVLFNRLRRDMQRIFDLRREDPTVISGGDLQTIVKASMIMDRDAFSENLSAVVDNLKAAPSRPPKPLKRLVLSGGMCNISSMHALIEDCGAAIVRDDSCSGARYFEGAIRPDGDIIESIAERYIEKIECPAKHADLFRRGEALVETAKTSRADGVIFLFLKFCDPHAFDYPYIKGLLDKEGVASMLLEIEAPLPSEEQVKTRCQAFLETL